MTDGWKPDDMAQVEVNNNLWYLIDCTKCHTHVMIEDSIDRVTPKDRVLGVPQAMTTIHCPRCAEENLVKYSDRIQVKYVRRVGEKEVAPVYFSLRK